MSGDQPPASKPKPTPPYLPPTPQRVVSIDEGKPGKYKPIRLSTVVGEGPSPLWEGYLYRGTYTLLSGDPGSGKTSVACDLVARLSAGRLLPQTTESIEPMTCVILASEDSAGMFRKRIEAGGGNLEKIEIIRDRPAPMLSELESVVPPNSFLFIETLDAHMGNANPNDNTRVRGVLQPMLDVLEAKNVACLTVRHWNKVAGQNTMYRSSGSIAYVAASRVALATSMDGARNRFLSVIRSSYCKEKAPLGFSFGVHNTIEWGAYDHVAVPGLAGEVADAVEFLRRELADGPKKAKVLRASAMGYGIPWHLVNLAKVHLCIKPAHVGFGKGSSWEWELPLIADSGPGVVDLRTLGDEPGEWNQD